MRSTNETYFIDEAMNPESVPLISIIVAVLNDKATLQQSIDSVAQQTYPNKELIIIDGGSRDGTVEVLKANREKITRWISEPDRGIYDAWNKGVKLAGGDWIGFLGAGDFYAPDALQSYADFIGTFSRDDLPEYVSSRVNLVSAGRVMRTIGRPWEWRKFCRFMTVAHVGSLHHKLLFERYGLYDTTYRICGDYELLLRPKEGLRAAFMDKITATMELDGVSNRNPLVFEETLRAKVGTGGRGRLICQFEKVVAMGKWKVRNWLGL